MGVGGGVDLSVVIVSYNIAGLLCRCLDSVFRALGESGLECEALVVDNASSDGSAEKVRARFPGVALIENESNRGFAAATNEGLSRSRGRYIFLLNPDTELIGDAASRLLTFMDAHPDAGMVTGQLLNADGTLQHGAFHFPNLWMGFLDFFPINHRLAGSRLNGRYELGGTVPFEIDHPLGASMMVRRQVIEEVGPLDEAFFIYCEEIDWCIRIKKAGWSIWCVPQARIIHHVAQSTRQRAAGMYVELQKSRSLLFRKHYSRFFRWAYRYIVQAGVRRELSRLESRRLSPDQAKAWRDAYQAVLRL